MKIIFLKQLFDFYTIGGWESIINIEEQLFSNFLKDPSQFSANKKRLEIFLSSRDVLTSVIYKKMKALEIKAISKAAKQQVKAREILNIELNKYQITPVLKEREEHDENGVPHKVMVTTYVFKHPTNLEALKGLLPLLFEVSAEIKKYNHSLSGSKSELKALNSEQKNKTAQKNITGLAYDRTKKRITENIEKLKRRILEKQAQLANLLFNARMQNHPVCAIVIHLLNEKNYETEFRKHTWLLYYTAN